MGLKKNILRREAKKEYKEMVRREKAPKGRRMPFSEFFKKYKELKTGEDVSVTQEPENKEDFSLENFISVNDLSEHSTESVENIDENKDDIEIEYVNEN